MKEYMGFVTAWKRPGFRGQGGAHRKGFLLIDFLKKEKETIIYLL
jgi:hypothetical protein